MAKNGANGGGRIGTASGRTGSRNSKIGLSIKRDGTIGRFSDIKQSGGAFKGVRREG